MSLSEKLVGILQREVVFASEKDIFTGIVVRICDLSILRHNFSVAIPNLFVQNPSFSLTIPQ